MSCSSCASALCAPSTLVCQNGTSSTSLSFLASGWNQREASLRTPVFCESYEVASYECYPLHAYFPYSSSSRCWPSYTGSRSSPELLPLGLETLPLKSEGHSWRPVMTLHTEFGAVKNTSWCFVISSAVQLQTTRCKRFDLFFPPCLSIFSPTSRSSHPPRLIDVAVWGCSCTVTSENRLW